MSRANELMRLVPIAHIRAINDRAPDDLVRVYSYQSHHAWDRAQETGYLTGCDRHIEQDDHPWPKAYQWMRAQMAERIEGFSGDYPMWAWLKRPSTKPKERRYRGTNESIRITALVPRRRVLISNYETWHCVLNNSLICERESEWDDFYLNNTDDDPQTQRLVENSWTSVFDFAETDDPEVRIWRGYSKYFRPQACIDRIHLDEIVNLRYFDIEKSGKSK